MWSQFLPNDTLVLKLELKYRPSLVYVCLCVSPISVFIDENSNLEPRRHFSSDVTHKLGRVFDWSKTDARVSGEHKVTCLTASSLGRRYVCRCRVFLSALCCRVCEWRHLLQQRHRGLAEGLNHSHGNVQSWERADKHKHSPYQNTQTWKTSP